MTLAQLLNQNSFLIPASLTLLVWLAVLIVRRARRRFWLMWSAALLLAIGVYVLLRTPASRAFQSVAEVQQAISSGRPTLVEFYSDF